MDFYTKFRNLKQLTLFVFQLSIIVQKAAWFIIEKTLEDVSIFSNETKKIILNPKIP